MTETPVAAKKSPAAKVLDAVGGEPIPCAGAACHPCHRVDLQMLVTTTAVVAKAHEAALNEAGYQWADAFDPAFGAVKREATLPVARLPRTGYLYLYYAAGERWDVWQVMDNGLTRKIVHQADHAQCAKRLSAFVGAKPPKACSQGAKNHAAHLICIENAAFVDKLWVAHSARLWTLKVLERYAANPEVQVPGPDGKPGAKKKLRELRGREYNPKTIVAGAPAAGCLPLDKEHLARHVADYVAHGKPAFLRAFANARRPLDEARFGQAGAFADRVRAIERASAVPVDPERYVNKSVIVMVPDAEGVAEAHNTIRLDTLAARQGWMAGDADVTGKNADPSRPWDRQSLLYAAWIRDWAKAKERAKHQERLDQGLYRTTHVISAFEYQKILEQEKRTGQPVNPPGTTYERLAGTPERYRVTWPKEHVDKGIDGLADAGSKDKIARYNKHLDWSAIEAANKKWLEQEKGWQTLLEARDRDYVAWLESTALQAALGHDFDDDAALRHAGRKRDQLMIDIDEAVGRLEAVAACYGGGACSDASLKHLARLFRQDEADKTHHIAQALFAEFDIVEKVKADKGIQADLYDALTAKTESWQSFKEAWEPVRERAAASTAVILQTATQVTRRLEEAALDPAIAKNRGLQVALAEAAQKQVIWARAAGLAHFLETGQRQYMIGVKWKAGAFAEAASELMLQGAAVQAAKREVTGKQARRTAVQTRAELKPLLARNSLDTEVTVMLLVDQAQLKKIAAARGERMLEVVSPGLFGAPQNVVAVPESMAREIVRQTTTVNPGALKSIAAGSNIAVLILQWRALTESWKNLVEKGGLEQRDALASMLGAVAGLTGAGAEIAALLLTPPAKRTLGTPAAAVLSKLPAHFYLRYAAGLMLATGAVFDGIVAWVRAKSKDAVGDSDAADAYFNVRNAQLVGGVSLGFGAFYAHRARVMAHYGAEAVVRLLGRAITPVQLARCLTGVGLLLWLAGLGLTFYAMYLEDDDNEVFLRRSRFGTGHPQLGKFADLDQEVQTFGALSLGSRAEMEWHDVWGPDDIVVRVKLFKPDPEAVVTVVVEGFDGINGKKLADIYSGELPAPRLSTDKSEAANDIHTTERTFSAPEGVEAARLTYALYKDRTPRALPIARGDSWIED